jgi:hypothetical protein
MNPTISIVYELAPLFSTAHPTRFERVASTFAGWELYPAELRVHSVFACSGRPTTVNGFGRHLKIRLV